MTWTLLLEEVKGKEKGQKKRERKKNELKETKVMLVQVFYEGTKKNKKVREFC